MTGGHGHGHAAPTPGGEGERNSGFKLNVDKGDVGTALKYGSVAGFGLVAIQGALEFLNDIGINREALSLPGDAAKAVGGTVLAYAVSRIGSRTESPLQRFGEWREQRQAGRHERHAPSPRPRRASPGATGHAAPHEPVHPHDEPDEPIWDIE